MYITVKSIKRNLGFKGIEISDIIIALPVLIIFIILFCFTPFKIPSIVGLMIAIFCLLPVNVSKKNRMYKVLILIFKYLIRDKIYSSRKDASTKLYESFSLLKAGEETKLGTISGFDIIGTKDELWYKPVIYVKGNGKYKVEISNLDEIGNIYKLENILKSFDNKINTVKEQITYNEKQLMDIKDELDKPFTALDRIKELQKEKARIDSELDLDKQEIIANLDDENVKEMEK